MVVLVMTVVMVVVVVADHHHNNTITTTTSVHWWLVRVPVCLYLCVCESVIVPVVNSSETLCVCVSVCVHSCNCVYKYMYTWGRECISSLEWTTMCSSVQMSVCAKMNNNCVLKIYHRRVLVHVCVHLCLCVSGHARACVCAPRGGWVCSSVFARACACAFVCMYFVAGCVGGGKGCKSNCAGN